MNLTKFHYGFIKIDMFGPNDKVIRRARQFSKIGRIDTNETACNAVVSRAAARRTSSLNWTGNTSSRPSSSSRRWR
uniref:Uncharacterized protein n=1 Tax=Trichogramma kaykai TaxID=54128 RepID=A0ABD2XQQ8_9HYME